LRRRKELNRLTLKKKELTGGEAGEAIAKEVMEDLRPRIQERLEECLSKVKSDKDEPG